MSGSDLDPMAPRLDDDDPGEPIEVLAALAIEPSSGFFGRIRRSLDRRLLVSQALDLSWWGPLATILEYLKMIVELVSRPSRSKGDLG